MLTVYDLYDLFIDGEMQQVEIWSNKAETVVFSGLLGDAIDTYGGEEINSIDNLYKPSTSITINID